MIRLVISLIASLGLAYAVECGSWTRWQALGVPYSFGAVQLVDELRERECRSGNERWREVMSRGRSVASPMYIIYGDTATGPRVLGLDGTEPQESIAGLLNAHAGPLLILVTPEAVERYDELLQRHVHLVVAREGVWVDPSSALSFEALADALAAFVIQAR